MKRRMKYIKMTKYLILAAVCCYFCLLPLYAVNKEDNDMLFIISLYEHKQYEMAKKQIQVYESEFTVSQYSDPISYIKANIAFAEYRYPFADSIYSILMYKNIEQPMLVEVLVNKAYIKFDRNENLDALKLLTQAELITTDNEQLYRIELLKGRIYNRIYNPYTAQVSFERALTYKNADSVAISELVKSYLATNSTEQAKSLISELINSNSNLEAYSVSLNVWVDYLIAEEEYRDVLNLEFDINRKRVKVPDSTILRFAQTYILNNEYEAALNLLSQGNSYSYNRLFLRGLIYVKQGNDTQADSIFSELSSVQIPTQNLLPDSNEDIVISSWLERIKLLYKTSPEHALAYLNSYLSEKGKAEINPNVMYVYGSLLFKSKKYQEAANILILVKKSGVNYALAQNIMIMLGDIWFDARISDKAKIVYNQYINTYPQGRFRLHALYNIALIDFEQKDYKTSAAGLLEVISESADEEITEKAQLLLAEIDFYQANYNKAIEQYQKIKSNHISLSYINYRIAQSLYYSEDYQAASDFIPVLSIDSTNAFQILLLKGNINFNLKQYAAALDIYNLAVSHKKTEIELQEINSYIALTLYRMGRFSEASALYLKLSTEKESPQAYLIMAAKAAYHAKDFQQSLLLFRKFVEEHPESEFYNNALANIGSIYYNQSEYPKATQTWISLMKRYQNNQYFTDDEQIILQSTFSGLQWCLKQNPDQAVLDDINNLIETFKSEYIRFELQYLLLKVYYGSEQWGDLLQMADDLRQEFPHKENNEIRRYVAGSLSKLYRFEEADSVYQTIYKIEPTADILTEWADLEIQSGKTDFAITKLDQAIALDNSPQRLNKFMRILYDTKPDTLAYYWHKWEASFEPPPDQALFIWLQWNYDTGHWAESDSLANALLLNPDLAIRSKAQLIKGLSQYKLNNYESAIMELYKTIYLYADMPESVLEAKRHIVLSYLTLVQVSEAQKVYDEIVDDLTAEEQIEFEKAFAEKQTKDE
jgi:tetratricopeptide (TPR) repeat protein/TolA-binding protein